MRYKVKKLSLLFFLIIAATTVFAQTQTQPSVQKIGYVDSGVIMQQFAPAVKAASDLEALRLKYGKQLDSMSTALNAEAAEFQKKMATMKPDVQKETQGKLVAKNNAIQQFNQDKTNELSQKREQLMAPIKETIFKAIESVAKDESLNFVFDKVGDVVLLFADSSADVTFKVLDKLKRSK
jgi:outer membrane protein